VALSGTQRHSVAIKGTQWRSAALSGDEGHSVAIKGTQRQLLALSGTHSMRRGGHSVAMRRGGHSVAMRRGGHSVAMRGLAEANRRHGGHSIGGEHRQSALIEPFILPQSG
jgi:hypothetical protein